jgi:lipoprotein-releasing system permease protein
MFEFSVIKKYLIPKRKQLSVSLIAMMSILVISLVVWLLLLFFSVTEGIEKNWLGRLTALNAPIRVVPTEAYYRSYYYKIDTIAQNSNYSPKTIHEKLLTQNPDPYNPLLDEAIPSYWPLPVFDNSHIMIDPVKRAFESFKKLAVEDLSFVAKDYEISGAMLRLKLGDEDQTFLTQVCYVSTFPIDAKNIQNLLTKPTIEDINHLLYFSEESKDFLPILANIELESIDTLPIWNLPINLIPDEAEFQATILSTSVILGDEESSKLTKKELQKLNLPIRLRSPLTWKAKIDLNSLYRAHNLSEIDLTISGKVQGIPIQGMIPWKDLIVRTANIQFVFPDTPHQPPPWIHIVKNEITLIDPNGVIIPKSFRDSGVKIGDDGALSYGAFAASSLQEQRSPVRVLGFYDPGLMMVGARPIFAKNDIVQTINAASSSQSIDPLLSNGIQIWFDDLNKTKELAIKLQQQFDDQQISPYWQIKTFYDYDFAKDLLKQFQSDRYLFTLIGLIILIVACTNIISLLLLLVNGKKKEIAILQVLGAKKRHIAMIFGLCGAFLGTISGIIGTVIGLITLRYLDGLIRFLSFLQGQDAFNTAFYGSSLPNEISSNAIYFILLTTPLISLLAGLFPAIKACQFPPAHTLRSE